MDDSGTKLHFGVLRYQNSHVSTFPECVKPRDVNAALVLLTYLKLERLSVAVVDSLLFDSSMLLIKTSSEGAGVHNNSFRKPYCMFAWFVIDFLSMLILFDTFIDHCSLLAPMPFKNVSLTVEQSDMLVHNQKIQIKFCLGNGCSRVDKYFVNENTGDVGTGCLNMDKLWSTSTKYYHQLNADILSLFESYKESYIGEKKKQKLLIHHFVILQLFHPLFHFYPGDDTMEIQFSDNNIHLFVAKMNDAQRKLYIKTHPSDNPNFSWLWLGDGGKI